jgi:hypothetical protein
MARIIAIKKMPYKKTSIRDRNSVDAMAARNRRRAVATPQIEIKGKAIAQCFAEMQLVIVLQSIEQAKIEFNKLEKILKELKNYENQENYYCDFKSFDFLR